ncbi:hypothetical protein E4U43_004101 [Claviceps pusilla]|uniref:Uncharacterized protein n=1 Tax=Claviceps pusilla TaxID=123648 RepID=A0A9P7NHB3_9HYPO|nr:hypothetical protein E4U43_004101 [Claviceps pusilla]
MAQAAMAWQRPDPTSPRADEGSRKRFPLKSLGSRDESAPHDAFSPVLTQRWIPKQILRAHAKTVYG